jgi:uncharacterized protein
MSLVFVDTVGLLAVWNRSDQWHDDARRAYSQLHPDDTALFSTTLVMAECANALSRTSFRAEVDEFRKRLEESGNLIWPTAEDWQVAWLAFREGRFAQAGVVDQMSFLVMRRLKISRAFTNDRHFAAAGFETLF